MSQRIHADGAARQAAYRARVAGERGRLEARVRELEEELCRGTATEPGEIARLNRLLKARNTEIRGLKAKVRYLADRKALTCPKKLRRDILVLLHPDHAPPGDDKLRRKMERLFQDFSGLPFTDTEIEG